MRLPDELRRLAEDRTQDSTDHIDVMLRKAADHIDQLNVALVEARSDLGAARSRVAQHEETLHWVKVVWAGKEAPDFIPGFLTERLEEVR